MKTLAQRIRARREELGLSVSDLAYAVGVTIAAVMQWESGEVKSLRATSLMALSDALNVRPRWLESGAGDMIASTDRDAFRAALEHRDATAGRARLAWERIAAQLAKAAMMTCLLFAFLLAPPNAEAFFVPTTEYYVKSMRALRNWLGRIVKLMGKRLILRNCHPPYATSCSV